MLSYIAGDCNQREGLYLGFEIARQGIATLAKNRRLLSRFGSAMSALKQSIFEDAGCERPAHVGNDSYRARDPLSVP